MPTRQPRIFVADDQRDVLESLRLLLKSEGYVTETFANPESLLGALRERTADAVLMDLNYTRDTTSGDEGLDAVGKIRAFDANTPIVLMTAWGTIGLAVEGMRRGAQDFIEKPWDNERLLTVLRNQVALGRALQRARALEAENRELAGSSERITPASPSIMRSRSMRCTKRLRRASHTVSTCTFVNAASSKQRHSRRSRTNASRNPRIDSSMGHRHSGHGASRRNPRRL